MVRMHPGMLSWWKRARAQRAARCGSHAGPEGYHFSAHDHGDHHGGGGFGVKRPLRFLAHKLSLSDAQVEDVARIISTLKTERAQAAVDEQRALAAFADALAAEPYDAAKAEQGTKQRVDAQSRVATAVTQALADLHKVLDTEQRKTFAYLLRTGTVSI